MKKLSSLIVIAGVCLLQACGNGTGKHDSVDSAKDMNANKDTTPRASDNDTHDSSKVATTPVDKETADFAVAAANGGMMEVELGKLAQQNGASQRVKDFGKMMVDDHTKVNDQLKSLASSKNITLPANLGNDAQKHVNDLGKKTGKDFDKAYMNMMIDDHKKDIKDFEKAGKDLKDSDIKNLALQSLPTLQKHLDSAQAIHKMIK